MQEENLASPGLLRQGKEADLVQIIAKIKPHGCWLSSSELKDALNDWYLFSGLKGEALTSLVMGSSVLQSAHQ